MSSDCNLNTQPSTLDRLDKILEGGVIEFPQHLSREDRREYIRKALIDRAFDHAVEKYSNAIDELAKR